MTSSLAISDFPDRLSPMVVKELRQGLHTKVFGGVMLALHVLLILLTVMSGGSGDTSAAQAWFDGVLTLVLCVIFPLRGFSAVADELKSGTLDMLVLTRLSAGRIVFGKWASVASQSLLIALSVLPYVVARYVFGGLDLFDEVAALFYKWLAGVVVAAVIVALSTQRQFWLRAVVVGLPMLMGGCGMFSYVMVGRMGGAPAISTIWGPFGTMDSGFLMMSLVSLAAWTIFFFLSLAATRIAPAASLLSVVKRSVHLIAMLIVLALSFLSGTGLGMSILASSMLSLVMLDVMTERVNEVPSVYAAFYRRGWFGRAALWLLAPGWMTGFLYSLLLVALVAAQAWHSTTLENAALVVVGASGTWMIAVVVQSFPPSRKAADLMPSFIAVWLIVSVVISSLGGLVMMPFSMGAAKTAWFTCVLPQLLPMGYATAPSGDKAELLDLGVMCSLIWPALLLGLGLFAWHRASGARLEGWRIAHGTEGGQTA